MNRFLLVALAALLALASAAVATAKPRYTKIVASAPSSSS